MKMIKSLFLCAAIFGGGWVAVQAQTTVNAIPWYRIYDPFSNSYLYSADPNEYSTLGSRGFTLQGINAFTFDIVIGAAILIAMIANIHLARLRVGGAR